MPRESHDSLLQKIIAHLVIVKGPDTRGEYVAWCPFHPDGKGTPPHQPNLMVSERGFICHACGESGSLRKLADKLGLEMPHEETEAEQTYNYCSKEGAILYQVVRRRQSDKNAEKKFTQRRPSGSGGWIYNLKEVQRVLYNLPEIVAAPDKTVFVVEGEKDCDRLNTLGMLATTNSGGAGKWRSEYSECLRDRDVVIIPDNDEPGRNHAAQVAKSLIGIARRIRIVELPGVPDKGDVSDFFGSGKSVDDLKELVAQAAEYPVETKKTKEGSPDDSTANKPEVKKSQGTVIAELAQQEGIELFKDERSEVYARLQTSAGRKIVAIASKEFDTFLGHLAWKRTGKAAGGEAIRAAKNVLEGKALYEGPTHPLHCRIANVGNEVWIDKDGTQAIRVIPGSWEVVDEPPILFRPNPHRRPLPDPVKDGDPKDIFKFTNIVDSQVALLFLCCLIAALYPGISVPILIVYGVQGSAKSTLLKMIKRLIDPHEVEVRGPPTEAKEYLIAAWHNRCLCYDNLASIPRWLSDAFCRTVTGDGQEKRKLYLDDASMVYRFQRILLLAGINLVAQNPDLLDRAILVELFSIRQDQRRPDSEFWEDFDRAAPGIFGGMLDVLARALELIPTLKLDKYPRMADFGKVGVAVAIVLGKTPDDFLRAYEKNVGRQFDAAIESSAVAQTLVKFMELHAEGWSGTAAGLLEGLTGC